VKIELISVAQSQGQIQQQALMSVMKMAMGNVEQQGEAIKELISTVDVSAVHYSAQPGLWGQTPTQLKCAALM